LAVDLGLAERLAKRATVGDIDKALTPQPTGELSTYAATSELAGTRVLQRMTRVRLSISSL
jgi:hypothetical protein